MTVVQVRDVQCLLCRKEYPEAAAGAPMRPVGRLPNGDVVAEREDPP